METITDRDIKRAAVVFAFIEQQRLSGRNLGVINVVKLPCSPRCAFEYPDIPEIRQLLDNYELRQILPIPQKTINQAYGIIVSQTKNLQAGRIGVTL